MKRGGRLAGKIAVVTGASSGIGAAAARRLAAEGAVVAIGARRAKELNKVAADIKKKGGTALAVELDVADFRKVDHFALQVKAEFGGCDILVANAGRRGDGDVEKLDVAEWKGALDTNLSGVFYTCKEFLSLMKKRAGWKTVVITASVAGTMGLEGISAYTASKWGVRGFAQSFALEAARHQIRVTTVNPGYVATDWHKKHPHLKEMIRPEDIADLVVYLSTMPESMLIDDVTVWPARMYSE